MAIAKAVAGRFDHYICRRDDNLRGRAPDAVPRIQALALHEAGVPDSAVSIIPDEQDAIEAALRMGEAGDLLLIFADALTRSWKQITKFKPHGTAAAVTPSSLAAAGAAAKINPVKGNGRSTAAGGSEAALAAETVPLDINLDGLIRDERGVRMAPESDD